MRSPRHLLLEVDVAVRVAHHRQVGRHALDGLVTMYMCSQACSGTVTPLMRPSSRAHMPAQLTRISVAMGPAGGLDAGDAPPLRSSPR